MRPESIDSLSILFTCLVVVGLLWLMMTFLHKTDKVSVPAAKTVTYQQLEKYGVEILKIEIDEHEYLYFRGPGYGSICHKADCKYCMEKK